VFGHMHEPQKFNSGTKIGLFCFAVKLHPMQNPSQIMTLTPFGPEA